jgi:hypothetical protein
MKPPSSRCSRPPGPVMGPFVALGAQAAFGPARQES